MSTETDILEYLQWPAMFVTLLAAWLVTSRAAQPRLWGFRAFIMSNVLWIIWGWYSQAFALVVLQVGLFLINWRGTEVQQTSSSN